MNNTWEEIQNLHDWSDYRSALRDFLPNANPKQIDAAWNRSMKSFLARLENWRVYGWWPEFTATFLPVATDEQKAILWERALEGLKDSDIDWVYDAERSIARILRSVSFEMRKKLLKDFNLDSLTSRSTPTIFALYAESFLGKQRHELFQRTWKVLIKFSLQSQEDEVVQVLKFFDKEFLREKWNEILDSYQSNEWEGKGYYDPNMGGEKISGLYVFQWLAALANVVPSAEIEEAIKQICDIRYMSAHPYRRSWVIKRLVAEREDSSQVLNNFFRKLLEEPAVIGDSRSFRDPHAIAAEILLLLPEKARDEEGMAKVLYAIRKAFKDTM